MPHPNAPHLSHQKAGKDIPPTPLERDRIPRRLNSEDAQQALAQVHKLLQRQAIVTHLVQRQAKGSHRAELVEHLVQRQHDAALAALINTLHPADIAFILASLAENKRQALWKLVSVEHVAYVLLEVEDWIRTALIQTMNHAELVAAASHINADELADLAPDLPLDVVADVQKGLSKTEQAQLLTAMRYPPGSVGAMMDFEIVRVREDITLEVVLRYLRRRQALPNHTDQIFVVDRQNKLCGTLSISKLLLNSPEQVVREIMHTDSLTLSPLDADTDAAGAFERYDLVSAPVIDEHGRLMGRVTIAGVLDVIREDTQEQALSRAGLQEEDIFAPIALALRNRAPWLLFNLCTASIASFIASRFTDTVSRLVSLAFLMSIVAGIGGNSGNQTMTMVIRALAVGRITGRNLGSLIKRELQVTACVGLCGSTVAALFAWAISKSITIALVMMAAMILNMLVGASMGVLVPILRHRFGKDPAMGSSVLLTFATDALGFFIFLGLATMWLF